MRIVISQFMSLDGVVQAPGGPDEDTDGRFAHGGWSMPYFDPEAMGPVLGETMATTDALLFGRRTWQTMAAAWPGRQSLRRSHERDPQVRRLPDAGPG
jgi:dihydrofolate reductase